MKYVEYMKLRPKMDCYISDLVWFNESALAYLRNFLLICCPIFNLALWYYQMAFSRVKMFAYLGHRGMRLNLFVTMIGVGTYQNTVSY